MDGHDDILRTSKLDSGTKMTISLKEIDSSNNLEDGRPSHTLFTYYVSGPEYFKRFEPTTPQHKKLKGGFPSELSLCDNF